VDINPVTTNIVGIFQSDLIIQSAIVESLKRIYDSPDEIDYVFNSLIKDKLTSQQYGQKQIDSFKTWFLNSDIPCSPAFRVDETKLPIITFSLMNSDEAYQFLGDIHYITHEDTDADWPPLAGPFNPVAYFPSSGIMQLPFPNTPLDDITITPGMFILSNAGTRYLIVDVLDTDIISLTPGIIADFTGCFLERKPKLVTSIESTRMKETYSIGIHVQGEAFYLIALHAILSYSLNKYKEELLEARGFEISTVTNTEFRRNNDFGQELVFSRWLNISGVVEHVWAKRVFKKIQEVNVQPIISEPDYGIIISAVDDDQNNPPVDEAGLPAQTDDPFTVRPQ